MYNLEILEKGCEELGITLNDTQKNQFIQFYEFLVEKNKVMNLTGITEFDEVLVKHFLDSLFPGFLNCTCSFLSYSFFLCFHYSECYQCLCPALLSRYTRSTEISAGDTPEIRDAWPMDTGL